MLLFHPFTFSVDELGFLFFEFWDPVLSFGSVWVLQDVSNVQLLGVVPFLRFLFSVRERGCRE